MTVKCLWCHRKLTAPKSVERRMGDKCAAFDKQLTEALAVMIEGQRRGARMSAAHEIRILKKKGGA